MAGGLDASWRARTKDACAVGLDWIGLDWIDVDIGAHTRTGDTAASFVRGCRRPLHWTPGTPTPVCRWTF